MAITVSIVEDNDQLRGTLARVLSRAEGFRCLGQHATAEAALEALPKERPEVVLMDINLPGMSGVECVRQLKQLLPETQVMMLTAYEDAENIFNSLAAGASGYMLKRTKTAELLEAVREVIRGGSPMTTHIARKVVQYFNQRGSAEKRIYRRAKKRSSIVSPKGSCTRKSRRSWVSATKRCTLTSAASTKSSRSGPERKPSPNSCDGKSVCGIRHFCPSSSSFSSSSSNFRWRFRGGGRGRERGGPTARLSIICQ